MDIVFVIVIGLCLGSFVSALAWRLYIRRSIDKSDLDKKALQDTSIIKGRSMCPNCRHVLSPLDLVPVLSWLFLRGKCRYCHKEISWQYPLIELSMSFALLISYIFWPVPVIGQEILLFCVWSLILITLMALLVYDFRWLILPNILVIVLAVLVVFKLFLTVYINGDIDLIYGPIAGALALFSIFALLFYVSKGKWIGGGDVKLSIALGLMSGGLFGAMAILFLSSLLGILVYLPKIFKKRTIRSIKLPYGPFLILATFIIVVFGDHISMYADQLFGI